MVILDSGLTITPIGFIRSGKPLKFDARHQPDEKQAETNVLEMLPGDKYQKALKDLEGFDRIWLIWWFHRNTDWRPEVLRRADPRKGEASSPHAPPIDLIPSASRRCS